MTENPDMSVWGRALYTLEVTLDGAILNRDYAGSLGMVVMRASHWDALRDQVNRVLWMYRKHGAPEKKEDETLKALVKATLTWASCRRDEWQRVRACPACRESLREAARAYYTAHPEACDE